MTLAPLAEYFWTNILRTAKKFMTEFENLNSIDLQALSFYSNLISIWMKLEFEFYIQLNLLKDNCYGIFWLLFLTIF